MCNSRACCTLYFICVCKEYSYVINAASLCTHFSFLILNYLQRTGNIDKNTETFQEEKSNHDLVIFFIIWKNSCVVSL